MSRFRGLHMCVHYRPEVFDRVAEVGKERKKLEQCFIFLVVAFVSETSPNSFKFLATPSNFFKLLQTVQKFLKHLKISSKFCKSSEAVCNVIKRSVS